MKSPGRAVSGGKTGRKSLHPGQHQFRPQAPDRGIAEDQTAPVKGGEIDHDRQSEPGTRLGFIKALASPRDLGTLGRR